MYLRWWREGREAGISRCERNFPMEKLANRSSSIDPGESKRSVKMALTGQSR